MSTYGESENLVFSLRVTGRVFQVSPEGPPLLSTRLKALQTHLQFVHFLTSHFLTSHLELTLPTLRFTFCYFGDPLTSLLSLGSFLSRLFPHTSIPMTRLLVVV